MIHDVDKLSPEELQVRDTRRVYDTDAEVHPVQEGAAAPPVEQPAVPEVTAPPKPSVLHVPSLLGGTIPFQVGELLPWKGVYFLLADVVETPRPHAILVPIEHTNAHKKLAQKHLQRMRRMARGAKFTPPQVADEGC